MGVYYFLVQAETNEKILLYYLIVWITVEILKTVRAIIKLKAFNKRE